MKTRVKNPSPMLARLYTELDGILDFVERTVSGANDAGRDLSPSEKETLTSHKARVASLNEQITPLEEWEELRAANDDAGNRFNRSNSNGGNQDRSGDQDRGTSLGARTEPREQYRTAGDVCVDLFRASKFGDRDAAERLTLAGIPIPGEGDTARAVANQTTGDLTGILPTPIVGAIMSNLDASRPFITSIGAKDLGVIPGKVFSRPVITQHVAVGEQTAEKTELTSQKMIILDVDFTKKTYGGVIDISRQSIDWTSPAAWNALLADLQDVYGQFTENAAADAFNTAIASTPIAIETNDFLGWSTALYAAAAQAYTGVKKLPNHMWVSLDAWAQMGPIVDQWRRQTASNNGAPSPGDSSPTTFGGNVLDFPRTVVPSFAAGTIIVGVKEKTEFYEQRIGLLTAVEPRLLGVEVAYGGYAAFGTLDAAGFAKVTPFTETP